ncbi:MAG: lamin tail domain-containing protein [Candidatus Paceibacterota bacterium]|jgi:hypothetical protein
MTKINFCWVFLIVFFAQTASAQVLINEVQISPIGERFIELYNSDTSDVDLTGWYIQRKTSSSFGSLVSSTNLKDKTIKANDYFVISRSQLSSSDVVVADLTLSASNAIRIRNSKGEDIDQVEWTTIDDGKSYQRMSDSSWIVSSPTSGVANTTVAESDSSSVDTQTNSTNTTTSSTNNSLDYFDTPMFARINVQSGSTVSGAPIIFSGDAVDAKKKPIDSAYYLWAFGDGETGSGKTVSHIFRYPGSYMVTLDVSSGQGLTPATTRLKVVVSSALLRMSRYADDSSVVVISNDGTKDIDLSSWVIDVGSRRFTIPEHTMILAGGNITLAPETTGFRAPLSFVNIYYPNGKPYEQIKKEVITEVSKPVSVHVPSRVSVKSAEVKSLPLVATPDVVPEVSQNQSASVIDAFTNTSTNSPSSKNEDGLWLWYTSAALLGALALFGIRYIKSREVKTTFSAADFVIIEKIDDFDEDEPR